MRTHVVIAVRGGPVAKSRCAPMFDAAQRELLVEAMIDDMLSALTGADNIDAIHLVTPTRAIADLALDHGADALLEDDAIGLNAALDTARRWVADSDADARLVLLPGDLPLIDPAELNRAIAAWQPGRLVIVPSNDGGTGALIMAASAQVDLCFGEDSAVRHADAARRHGLEPLSIALPSLAFDIDSPHDITDMIRHGRDSRTRAFLRAQRLSEEYVAR